VRDMNVPTNNPKLINLSFMSPHILMWLMWMTWHHVMKGFFNFTSRHFMSHHIAMWHVWSWAPKHLIIFIFSCPIIINCHLLNP
jgi:hypothetical protein